MELSGEQYRIHYDPSRAILTLERVLRLYGGEGYKELEELFKTVIHAQSPVITLNIEQLRFLNSSGINTIYKFVIKIHDKKASQLVIQGSNRFYWQRASLKNCQRLMPEVTLKLE